MGGGGGLNYTVWVRDEPAAYMGTVARMHVCMYVMYLCNYVCMDMYVHAARCVRRLGPSHVTEHLSR